jgi:hypothetical protein
MHGEPAVPKTPGLAASTLDKLYAQLQIDM